MKKKAFTFLAGISLFIGIPVLIWEPGNVADFARSQARLVYVLLTLVALVLIITLLPDSGLGSKAGATLVARQRLAVRLFQILAVAVMVIGPWSDRHQWGVLPGEGIRTVGVMFYVLGLGLMHWAVRCLGRQFSVQATIQKNHRLVTTGPYRFVRHPRYLGILLCFSGVALVFASGAALAVAGLLLPTILWRIADEETLMTEAFPAEWPAYARSTVRLFPWLY